jgi:Type II secretion system (T2SS), protein G
MECQQANPEYLRVAAQNSDLRRLPENMKHCASILSHMKLDKTLIGIASTIAALLTACDHNDEEEVTRQIISQIEIAAGRYKADCNQFPRKTEDLTKDSGVTGWQGPYVTEILDPWGVPFQFEIVDERMEIRSFGADRIKGNEDDITN